MRFVYDVNKAHDECYQDTKKEIEREHGPVQYVSLRGKACDSWTQFLLKPFIHQLTLPEGWSRKCISILDEFKRNVAAGIHHFTVAGMEESKLIINLPELISDQLVKRVKSYPTHAGIVTLHISHGTDYDLVYSLVQHDRETTLCCFRYYGDSRGISIASFDRIGRITLHSTSGMNDVLHTVTLIGLVHPVESGCNLFNILVKPESRLKGSFDPENIIPINKRQLLVIQRQE